MVNWLPAPVHRALLPIAHSLRHRWRVWRGTPLRGCSVVITSLSGDVLLLRHSYGPQGWAWETLGVCEEESSGSPHTAYLFTAMADAHPKPDGREVLEARFFPSHSLPEPLGQLTRNRLDIWRKRGIEAG